MTSERSFRAAARAMRRLLPAAAVMAAALAVSVPARADFASGLAAYEAGDFATAQKEWLAAAESGDIAAQRNLGHLYRWGKGVPQDSVKAAQWYRRAADTGFDRAQFNLAMLYLNGEGVAKDPAAAAFWLEKSAAQGNGAALYELARLLESGTGVLEDKTRALTLYRAAALTGHDGAKAVLAGNEAAQSPLPPTAAAAEQTPTAAPPPSAPPAPAVAALPAPAVQASSNEANKLTVPPDGREVWAHLASYKVARNADTGWHEIAEGFSSVLYFTPKIVEVDIPGKGHFRRLYATGDQELVRTLCGSMKARRQYCMLQTPEGKAAK